MSENPRIDYIKANLQKASYNLKKRDRLSDRIKKLEGKLIANKDTFQKFVLSDGIRPEFNKLATAFECIDALPIDDSTNPPTV